MVWGICFIATCVFILVIPTINAATSSFAIRFPVLVIPLALFAATLTAHMQGYVQLGRKLGSMLLIRSTQALMFALPVFMLSVIWSICANIWFSDTAKFADAIIGLLVSLSLIPAILFAIAIMKTYKRFGILTIAIAAIMPTAVATMWRPWPIALLVALSAYFLFRISSRKLI